MRSQLSDDSVAASASVPEHAHPSRASQGGEAADARVSLHAPRSMVEHVARTAGNQAAANLARTLPASPAMLQRFQASGDFTTQKARESLLDKPRDKVLAAALDHLGVQLDALEAFENNELPALRDPDRKDLDGIEQKLLDVIRILDGVRAKVEVARRTLLTHDEYKAEVEREPTGDKQPSKKPYPWHSFGQTLDAISDAVNEDLESIRSGAYVNEKFAIAAREKDALKEVRRAVYEAQEGKLGLLDRIASMVLAFMHTHDHVEYSLADAVQSAEVATTQNADVQTAWDTYKTRALASIYRAQLGRLLGGNKDTDERVVKELRTGLQAFGEEFDETSVSQSTDESAPEFQAAEDKFAQAQTYRDKWQVAYEYVACIRKAPKRKSAINELMEKPQVVEEEADTARVELQRALLRAGAAVPPVGKELTDTQMQERRAEAERQIANLSVSTRKPAESGHSDIQARNVAVALHDNTLLIAYNYTVSRRGITARTVPPANLLEDVLGEVNSAIEADRASTEKSGKPAGLLLTLEKVTFITVPRDPDDTEWFTKHHGEMQLLGFLQRKFGTTLSPNNVAFGVGKAVCRRCAAELDKAELAHRDTHFKRVTNWKAPDESPTETMSVTLAPPATTAGGRPDH